MLERISQIKEAVALYSASNDKVKPLSAADDDLLNNCVSALKPFDEVTRSISSESSCVSEIIPLVATLKVVLRDDSLQKSQGVNAMKAKLLLELSSRFDKLQYNDLYVIATLLDSRYKSKFLEQHALNRAIFALGKLCEDLRKDTGEDTSGEPKTKRRKLEGTNVASGSRSVSDIMTVLLSSSESDDNEDLNTDASKETVAMIDSYQKLKRIPSSQDPLLWWKDHSKEFPALAVLARIYLSCPSSSVASERLFSGAGIIYDEKRSKLSPERAQKLLVMKHNLPLIDFKV